jgi:hypothetical protein
VFSRADEPVLLKSIAVPPGSTTKPPRHPGVCRLQSRQVKTRVPEMGLSSRSRSSTPTSPGAPASPSLGENRGHARHVKPILAPIYGRIGGDVPWKQFGIRSPASPPRRGSALYHRSRQISRRHQPPHQALRRHAALAPCACADPGACGTAAPSVPHRVFSPSIPGKTSPATGSGRSPVSAPSPTVTGSPSVLPPHPAIARDRVRRQAAHHRHGGGGERRCRA